MNTAVQPTLLTIHAPSLVEHVYAQLRSHIISGYLVAGARLVELDVATQMHISQGSTREALGRLERDGLVERKDRRGTFVTAVSNDDMREIFALRAVVERFAVDRIAGLIHPWQIRELEVVLVGMREAVQRHNRLACVEHDHSFHQYIVQWANHATLLRIWRPLSAQIQRFVLTMQPVGLGEMANIVPAHQHLIEVLRSGDTSAAAAHFEQHVLHAWQQFDASLRTVQTRS